MSSKKPLYRTVLIISSVLFTVLMIMVLLLLYAERHAPHGNISDLEDALWFSIVTITTVGYGDIYPVTLTGRLVGVGFLIFSLGIYGYLISYISSIFTMINEHTKYGYNGTGFENHAVMIGWNPFGRSVIDQLIGVGKNVAIVVDDKNQVDLIRELYPKERAFILFSDLQNFEMIEKTNIARSAMVFINLEDDTEKLVYLLNIKKHFEKLSFIVTLDNANLKQTFVSAGVTYAISKHEIASKMLASYMYEPDVAEYSEDILSFAHSETDFDIKQFKVLPVNPYLGKSYGYAFADLRQSYHCILIGLSKETPQGRKLFKNPEDDLPIALNDYMILITNGKHFEKINKLFDTEEGLFAEH